MKKLLTDSVASGSEDENTVRRKNLKKETLQFCAKSLIQVSTFNRERFTSENLELSDN